MEVLQATDRLDTALFELENSLVRHTAEHLRRYEGPPSKQQRDARVFHKLSLLSLDAESSFLGRFSHFLGQLTRPRISIGGKEFSSYHVFGTLGILLAGIIALSLTASRGLSPGVMVTLFALAGIISWLNVTITKILTGKDRLVFLRYFVPILAGSLLFLRLTGRPVIEYLEPLMLGIGAMQGIGRIGCFMVGCCHGKPFPIGFQYNETHSLHGFPRRLLGIRFFPIQLLESAWIMFSVGTGIFLVQSGSEPGLGLAIYLVLFSFGRFCLEFIRGDRWRRHFGWFSEAQWVSYTIVSIVLLCGLYAVLPYRPAYIVIWLALTLLAGVVVFRRMAKKRPAIDSPAHRSEIIRSLSILDKGRQIPMADSEAVHIRSTAAGLQLSLGRAPHSAPLPYHYTLSFTDQSMRLQEARIIANIIGNWHPHPGKATLIQEKTNIFHLIRYI